MKHSLAFSILNDSILVAPASVRMCDFALRNALHPKECHRFNVAIDELLCNIINYAFTDQKTHYIAIQLDIFPDHVHITIRDDGIPFDLTTYPEPDLTLPLDERPTGGLGIHLVRKLIHQVSYERKLGQNVVHLAQFKEPADSQENT